MMMGIEELAKEYNVSIDTMNSFIDFMKRVTEQPKAMSLFIDNPVSFMEAAMKKWLEINRQIVDDILSSEESFNAYVEKIHNELSKV